jgi:hypothetical protein
MRKLQFVLLLSILFFNNAFSQTPVPMASQPGQSYTENFADITNWTNAFASGIGANRFGSVAVNATGTIPDGARITTSTATFVSGTSGGVQKGTGTLVLLSTGATDNTSSAAVDFLMDFTGVDAGTLSFDWASVNNSTGDRKGSLRVYYSTNGTSFSELTTAQVLNFTNNVPTSGSITTVDLPDAFNNNPNARLRFYYHNGSGGTTGSRPKISIDNLTVTAGASTPTTSVSASAGTNAAEPATSGTFTITSSSPAPAGGIVVTYTLAGTAIVGADYSNPQAGSVTIAATASSATITLPVLNDNDTEPTKTIQLTITNVTSPAIIGTASATINLTDDDVAPGILLSSTYNQNFNTLANAGTGLAWADNGTIAGWYSSRTAYNAGTGSSNAGALYSFGEAASTDRALGSVGSGSTGTVYYGARFKNNTGTTITKLKIVYRGEQWRNGGNASTQTVNFAYQTSNTIITSLTAGTWTPVTSLDFTSPVTGVTAATLIGNDAANSVEITYSITSLNIPANAEFMIRWEDIDHGGSDHGLSIDDFTIEANPVDLIPPTATTLIPANGATNTAVNLSASITFNEDVVKGTGNIVLKKSSDNSVVRTIAVNDATLTGRTLSVTLTNLQINTAYYLEVAAGAVTDLEGNPFAGISNNSTWAFTTGINVYVANLQNCSGGLSDGFTQYSQVGSIVWACTTFGRDPNAPAATTAFPSGVQINGFAGGTNVPNTDWLISPSFDLTATNYPLLSFWSRTAFNGQPLQLKVSTDYLSGDPSTATWTDINGKFPSQTSNVWTLSENINLSAFKGSNVHFAFVYHSDEDDGARWTLDDISLGNSPVPPPPSLTVSTTDVQFAFAASGTTADKTFTFIGNDLTNNVTLTSTGAFTLSKDGSSFSSSITYTIAEANNVSKTVYVRFAPTQNNQDFTGNIAISTGDISQTVSLSGTSIDPVTTLEVVNWNIEWFGSAENGPTNDAQQEQNVKAILNSLNADVYAVTEIVSEERLKAVVDQMPGYTYVISNYGSHTNTSVNPASALATAQKLAFIYKTSVFSNVTTTALLSQGINSAADITNPAYNYWASGRFPYMLSADVTLNCITKPVKLILVHGKANTSPTAESYNRRKRGADTLHYTLQQNYANDNIIMLGDYNDDLDLTITAGINPPVTSYISFTSDVANFTPVTLPLSLAGKKSTVSYNDIIDHVTVSNELVADYLPASAKILTDVTSLVSNYGSTTSDHYPVFSRYRFSNTTAPAVTTCTAEVKFCAATSNSYSVPAFIATDDCGDAPTYAYTITGATERNGTGNDASGTFNIGTSLIVWTATDSWGNAATCSTTVIINANPTVIIPDAYALPTGTLANTVYIGYAPASSLTLTANASGGAPAYSYSWSSGVTTSIATVSPTTGTTYTVTVTDANGCQATAEKSIDVLDIRSGKKLDKVTICHQTGSGSNNISISQSDVTNHLAHGDMLGSCAVTAPPASARLVSTSVSKLSVQVLPNPSAIEFTLLIKAEQTGTINLRVLDIQGRVLEQRSNISPTQKLVIGEGFRPGIYFAEITQGTDRKVIKLLKL